MYFYKNKSFKNYAVCYMKGEAQLTTSHHSLQPTFTIFNPFGRRFPSKTSRENETDSIYSCLMLI